MGSVTWRAEGRVEATPDAVYAWMSDLSADDHNSEAFKRGAGVKDDETPKKPAVRKILSREGNVLHIEDTWDGSTYKQTVTLDPVQRTVRIEGAMGYDSTWRVAPDGRGARLSVEGRMGRGLIGSLMKLFEKKMQKSMEQDFNGHIEDCRETLRT